MLLFKPDGNKPGKVLLEVGAILFIFAALTSLFLFFIDAERGQKLLFALVATPALFAMLAMVIVLVDSFYDYCIGGGGLGHYLFAFKFNWRGVLGTFLLLGVASVVILLLRPVAELLIG